MEDDIKNYADSLYDQAERHSLDELQRERREVLVAHRSNANLPIGGSQIQAVMACHVRHIERCMEAKLQTYQTAFEDAGAVPTEEDLKAVFQAVQQRQEHLVKSAASAVNQFVLTRGGINHDLTESIRNSTGHGHDRVLRSWKVWKAKHNVKRRGQKTLKKRNLNTGAVYEFHPAIIAVAEDAYEAGQLKHAVIEAFIRIIDEVKQKSGLTLLDGDTLMNRTFGIEKQSPKLTFNALATEADRDEHRGFMYLFKGIIGIRNNYAHTNTKLDDPEKAHEYLTLASFLMRLLDSAKQ